MRCLNNEPGMLYNELYRYRMGECVGVFAKLLRRNAAIAGEDSGLVMFEFDSSGSGLFDGNRLLDHAAENTRLTMGEMLLEGEDAALRLDGHGRLYLRARGGEERLHDYAWTNIGFAGDCVGNLQRHVLRGLGGDTPLENRGRDYLRNVEIEEAIYQSDELQRRVQID